MSSSQSAETPASPSTAKVLSASYLEKSNGKKELVSRLRKVSEILRTNNNVEPDSTDFPGLAAMSSCLVGQFLIHKDKEVRLHAVLCCMELFAVYAPEAPWTEKEILEIFRQTIRQLGNLAHTTNSSQSNFDSYQRILELLAVVKIGVVLVDLAKNDHGSDSDDSSSSDDDDDNNDDDDDDDESSASGDDDENNNNNHHDEKEGRKHHSSTGRRRQKRNSQRSSHKEKKHKNKNNKEERPLELLAELFRTSMQSLRPQHPNTISDYVLKMISGCLEEYYGGVSIPFPLVEEILIVVGQGPTLFVPNPALAAAAQQQQQQQQNNNKKKKKGKTPPPPPLPSHLPLQIEKQNPAYKVAQGVIRQNFDRLSTPIANLLNGLINGESHIVEQSSITTADDHDDDDEDNIIIEDWDDEKPASDNNNDNENDIWKIIYQVGRISSSLLTTVIGTVSICLTSEDSKRHRATKLLGKLFRTRGSKFPAKHGRCYKQWLNRYRDKDVNIRLFLVDCLMDIIKTNKDQHVHQESQKYVMSMMEDDPDWKVRQKIVEEVCDYAYNEGGGLGGGGNNGNGEVTTNPISIYLLKSVSSRVASKHPEERLKTLTGMGQVYFNSYIRKILRPIETTAASENGNDEDDSSKRVELISQVLAQNCSNSDIFYDPDDADGGKADSNDNDDQAAAVAGRTNSRDKYRFIGSRIFQCFSLRNDPVLMNRLISIIDDLLLGSEISKSKKKKISPTARVVGLAIVLDSLRNPGQSIVADGRRGSTSNPFQFMAWFFRQRCGLQKALGAYLDARSEIKEYDQGSEEREQAEQSAMSKLKNLSCWVPPPPKEDIKDILESLHAARDKRIFQTLGVLARPGHTRATVKRALDDLPKRTLSLGDGVSQWVEDLVRRVSMGSFLNANVVEDSIRLAYACLKNGEVTSAAALLANADFAVGIFPSICVQTESFDALKSMFKLCLRSLSNANAKKKKKKDDHLAHRNLLTLITRLLSRVARAVVTSAENQETIPDGEDHLDKGIRKQLLQLCTNEGTPLQARFAVATLATLFTKPNDTDSGEPIDGQAFTWLLKELTQPSKLMVDSEDEGSTSINILSALTVLVEHSPRAFSQSPKGESAVKFALEKVLLGRGSGAGTGNESDSDGSDSDASEDETPKRKRNPRKKKGVQHLSPDGKAPLENDDLAMPCRRIVAGIEFLACYVRCTILASKASTDGENNDGVALPSARVKAIFDVLSQIIRDKGVPPSKRDRMLCRAADHAVVRQVAAVQLLRLLSYRLGLKTYLTTKMWHVLGSALVDEEQVVRETVVDELTALLDNRGAFSNDEGTELRLVALFTLCADGERGKNEGNGCAANVGPHRIMHLKAAAERCFVRLRQAWQRAAEREDDNDDEGRLMPFLPENVVPYAFHLLAFRKETPSEEASKTLDNSQKALKKRLRLLFEPLVKSCENDSPDNLSFLLSMSRSLSGYIPITDSITEELSLPSGGVTVEAASPLSLGSAKSENSTRKVNAKTSAEATESQAKLKAICAMANTIIDSFVKKDVNLPPHPAKIFIPLNHYQKAQKPKKRKRPTEVGVSAKAADNENKSSKKQRVPKEVNLLKDDGMDLELPGVSPIKKTDSPPLLPKSRSHSSEEDDSPGERRICTQSVETTPNRRLRARTAETPSTLGPQTQQEEEEEGSIKQKDKKNEEESLARVKGKKTRNKTTHSKKSSENAEDESEQEQPPAPKRRKTNRNKENKRNEDESLSRKKSIRKEEEDSEDETVGDSPSPPRKTGKRARVGDSEDEEEEVVRAKPLKDSNRARKAKTKVSNKGNNKRTPTKETKRRSGRLRS